MHGVTENGDVSRYTDADGDCAEVSAVDDNDGRPVVALALDTEGDIVHLDVRHVEDFVAAIRARAAEARLRYGNGDSEAPPHTSVLQELVEVFAEGGHGDNADRHALDLLARYRAELAAEEAVDASL